MLALAGSLSLSQTKAQLFVSNPSFENLTGSDLNHFDAGGHLLDGHYSAEYGTIDSNAYNTTTAVPGWLVANQAGTQNYTSSEFATIPDGQNAMFLNLSGLGIGQATQVLGDSLQANLQYTLSVFVGTRSDAENAGYRISLYAGGVPLAETVSPVIPPSGTFQQVQLQFTSLRTDPRSPRPRTVRRAAQARAPAERFGRALHPTHTRQAAAN